MIFLLKACVFGAFCACFVHSYNFWCEIILILVIKSVLPLYFEHEQSSKNSVGAKINTSSLLTCCFHSRSECTPFVYMHFRKNMRYLYATHACVVKLALGLIHTVCIFASKIVRRNGS